MPPRRRVIDLGAARGRAAVEMIGRELGLAIRSHRLSNAAVGRDVGLSGAQVGRVVRGKAPHLTIVQASELLAAVGQELAIRAYPGGQPLRDTAHLALLGRLRALLHPSLTWRSEVPLPSPGDLRAWDAMILGSDWRQGVEAETRLHDVQALQRRILLKQRDGDVDHVILLLADTRHNRTLLHGPGSVLTETFPMSARGLLGSLATGVYPAASGVVLL
jgi:hypothetical protein